MVRRFVAHDACALAIDLYSLLNKLFRIMTAWKTAVIDLSNSTFVANEHPVASDNQEDMPNHFPFLHLPRELRDIVYHDLLCTWELKHERERAYLSTRLSNPTTILLLNRQIYSEAYDYLIKHNQFIRIDCDGISIRSDPLGRQILPVTEDPEKINHFNGYIARIKWSTNSDPLQKVRRKQYMVLGRQLPDILKCTDYHIMTQWPALKMTIAIDPISTSTTDPNTPPLRPFQISLLTTVPTLLHAFPGLTIEGPAIPNPLAARIIRETAQPRWTTPGAALADLLWFKQNSTRLEKETYYLSTNTAIECGLKTIEYMRASPVWPDLVRAGGMAFSHAVSELAFELRVGRARRALDAMERLQGRRNRVEEFALHVDADLDRCLPAGCGDGEWVPDGEMVAVVLCLRARKLRVVLDVESRDVAVGLVERALRMDPGNEMVLREREAVGAWSRRVDRYLDEVWVSSSGAMEEVSFTRVIS